MGKNFHPNNTVQSERIKGAQKCCTVYPKRDIATSTLVEHSNARMLNYSIRLAEDASCEQRD
jgi:hypothetical protein